MTEAALATESPHAPSVIRLLLDKLGIAYEEVLDHHGLNASRKVQAVLLDDAVGALMVLFPQSQLLDLNRLAELTGRRLTAVSTERLQKMLGKHSLSLLPGLPALTSSPCLYEESLLREPKLLINSGEPGVLLEITSEHFKTMLTKASAANFGENLTSIRPNLDRPDDDRKEITQAVQAFTARRIQQRLEATIEIPPLAETAQKIIKLRVDPNATIDDITGVVETDPALAAQVVSWAASPYYASPGKIRSVEDAIVRVLGFDLVINLALGLVHVGGGHDHAHAGAINADTVNKIPELRSRQRVHAGRRLIENQKIRVMDQRAAQAELLLHAPGEFACRALQEFEQPGGLGELIDALAALCGSMTEQAREELQILLDRERRIQVLAQPLRHIGDARAHLLAMRLAAHVAAQHLDGALLDDAYASQQ